MTIRRGEARENAMHASHVRAVRVPCALSVRYCDDDVIASDDYARR